MEARQFALVSVINLPQPCKAVFKMAHGKELISAVHNRSSTEASKDLTRPFVRHPVRDYSMRRGVNTAMNHCIMFLLALALVISKLTMLTFDFIH